MAPRVPIWTAGSKKVHWNSKYQLLRPQSNPTSHARTSGASWSRSYVYMPPGVRCVRHVNHPGRPSPEPQTCAFFSSVDRTGRGSWECLLTWVGGAKVRTSEVRLSRGCLLDLNFSYQCFKVGHLLFLELHVNKVRPLGLWLPLFLSWGGGHPRNCCSPPEGGAEESVSCRLSAGWHHMTTEFGPVDWGQSTVAPGAGFHPHPPLCRQLQMSNTHISCNKFTMTAQIQVTLLLNCEA